MLYTCRYYRSASGEAGTWVLHGQQRNEVPEGVEPVEYARTMLDRLVSVLSGDDGVRLRVWVGEAATDAEAEVDLTHPWTADVQVRLDDIARCRAAVDEAEARARQIAADGREARAQVKRRRAALANSVYVGTLGGVPQTQIVTASRHERNWVRTTVLAVEADRIAASPLPSA